MYFCDSLVVNNFIIKKTLDNKDTAAIATQQLKTLPWNFDARIMEMLEVSGNLEGFFDACVYLVGERGGGE